MSKFTPGPYIAEVTEDGQLVIVAPNAADDYHRRVAYIGDMETTTGQDHCTSDLLAAAPELLAACESFMRALAEDRFITVPRQLADEMRAAIAKARGEATP